MKLIVCLVMFASSVLAQSSITPFYADTSSSSVRIITIISAMPISNDIVTWDVLQSFIVVQVTGLEEVVDVSVYPNPVVNVLNVGGGDMFSRYIIVDIKGVVIKQGVYQNSIDIGLIGTGVYILILSNDREYFQYKFIKQ